MKTTARTVGFRSGERNIFFHILTACNLSCSHCYINHSQHGTKQLSRESILKWLEIFAEPEVKGNVIFLGGEPTMHPDLVYGIVKAKQLGFSVTVDSNGYLFHDFLDRVSPDMLDYLSFSLDGPSAAVNDPIRGDGVFDVCTQNLEKAVAKGFAVSVIYTVSRHNIASLQDMLPLLERMGVKRFFIQVIGLRGKSAPDKDVDGSKNCLQVGRDQWLNTIPRVAQMAAEQGIHVTFPKVFLDKDEVFECAGVVAENYFIFPNGRVYQCPLCEDYPVNSYVIDNNQLKKKTGLTEDRFMQLQIAEGCVMNTMLQPDTLSYDDQGIPEHRISCCLLKQEIVPDEV